MQYITIEIKSQSFLIDVGELNAVESFGADCISDGARLEDADAPLAIAYGAYIPQKDATYEMALVDLLGAKGSWLGHIDGHVCNLISVQDIRSYGTEKVGRITCLPFAALLRVHRSVIDKINSGGGAAVTGFIRYSNMSPADNLLNRKGLFALAATECRIKGDLSHENWGHSIDRSRAIRATRNIK